MDNYISKYVKIEYIIIPLTKGKEAWVSVEDVDLATYRWYAHHSAHYYAAKYFGEKFTYLHRMVATRIYGEIDRKTLIDHINNNPLDNRRDNLRLATPKQNCANSRKKITNKSGYKGVSWDKNLECWRAFITENGKSKHIGVYSDIEDARNAYKDAAIKLHGKFARYD